MGRKCLSDTKYTIAIITLLISSLITWSAYRKTCIAQCLKSTIATSCLKILAVLDHWRRLGTDLLKDANGIGKMQPQASTNPASNMTAIQWSGLEAVLFVKPHTISETRGENFAPQLVSRLMQAPSERQDDVRPVYNLTVQGAHCYYANGILVHNCILLPRPSSTSAISACWNLTKISEPRNCGQRGCRRRTTS